jgi:proteasome lid subunit RPN8/RPN11
MNPEGPMKGIMNGIVLTPHDLKAIGSHGEASYPEECCGFLIGRAEGDSTSVERLLAVDNERQDSRHNRFLISPETILAAQKEARGLGLDIVGYYHSHPDHPARPSDFDREHAWPWVSYLIVSLQGRKVVDTRSWRLRDDRESYDEEVIDQAALGIQKEAV